MIKIEAYPFILLFAFFQLFKCQQNSLTQITCPSNCALCSPNLVFCNACIQGFEPSYLGQCISSKIVDNCQLYGIRDTCSVCKPTYRLMMNNNCVKMSDGCLIAGPNGVCTRCLDGAIRNQNGQCSAKNLNCMKMTSSAGCILCQLGYKLVNGKCINNDTNCQYVEEYNGLCMLCKKGYKLLEYYCIKEQQAQNCYLISQDLQTCSYCKMGYQSYFGKCYTMKYIETNVYKWNNGYRKCLLTQYFNVSNQKCIQLPLFCQKFDYGFQRCVSCITSNVIIGGFCRDPSLRFCSKFDEINVFICIQCQPQFFLTNNLLCRQFPPFCEKVSNQQCVKCIDRFLLNSKFLCQDPNCEIADPITSICAKCKTSYFKNFTTNICTFEDINCIAKGVNSTCMKCKQNYFFDSLQNICKFKDPNCKLFSDKQKCLQCRSGFYLNSKNNLCIELPYKCLNTDQDGNCQYCAEGFSLMTSRQCMMIVNISNCQIPVPSNLSACQKCKEGYYKDSQNMCKQSPIFCQKFDPVKLICQKCNQNSINKNGLCFDNFCQYFTDTAQCLGCKPGYQYGPKGECIPQKIDPNCKQYMNGRCRVCSDRYYFNFGWKCTNVSNLCQKYNPNNGDCTSCYLGYVLDDGKCIRQSEFFICQQFESVANKRCAKCRYGYILNSTTGQCYYNFRGCIKKNDLNGQCLKCLEPYLLDQNVGVCLKITNYSSYPTKNTTQTSLPDPPQYQDPNCLTLNSNRTSCQTCSPRNFFSSVQLKCLSIDANCKDFNSTTGWCLACYAGYNVSVDNMSCELAKPKDKNCKVIVNDSSLCSQCYSGYYWDNDNNECRVLDSLCQTANEKTGACLSCWSGYVLKLEKCVLQIEIKSIAQAAASNTINKGINNSSFLTINTQNFKGPKQNCQQFDQINNLCIKCSKKMIYDLHLNNCQSPLLGLDENCVQYRKRLCRKCKPNYILQNKICKLQ